MDADYELIEMYQAFYDMDDRYETEAMTCVPHIEAAERITKSGQEVIW